MRMVLSVSMVAMTAAWAPLDGIAGLFGSKPLHDVSALASRMRPLEHVEHVKCKATLGGCSPAEGCRLSINVGSMCTPQVGHYWVPSDVAMPNSAWFMSFLPAIKPSYHMQTARGVLEIKHGFFTNEFRLIDVRAYPRLQTTLASGQPLTLEAHAA